MRIKPYSYKGNLINDTTNYITRIPGDILLQGSAKVTNIDRAGMRPIFAAKKFEDYDLILKVEMRGDVYDQLDELKTWFSTSDLLPYQLIFTDADDSDKQWYLMAAVVDMKNLKGNSIDVYLNIADPIMRSVIKESESWSITASGDKKTLTALGNEDGRPRFEITPTTAGGDRYAYRQKYIWRNPSSSSLNNIPLDIVDASLDTAALIADSANYVLLNGAVDEDDTTFTFDGEVGDVPSSGLGYLGTEQVSWTAKTSTQLTGLTRGLNGTTAAAHADNDILYLSHMQADGDDLRVFIDGVEVNRWLGNINTNHTKIWCKLSFRPDIEIMLGANTNNYQNYLYLADSRKTISAFNNLPNNGQIRFGTELMSYAGMVPKSRKISSLTRGLNGTTAASHTKGDLGYWVEHDIWIYWGNSVAEAPDTDDTYKPLFDLDASTNSSWVYDGAFWDTTGLRMGAWYPSVTKTINSIDVDHQSAYYTDSEDGIEDPATIMGMSLRAYQSGTKWKAENGTIEWNFYHPSEILTITATGEKYRYTSSWPSACLYKSKDGNKWSQVWKEATPGSTQIWVAIDTHSAVAIGSGYSYVKVSLSGAIAASSGNVASYGVATLTATFNTSNIPQLVALDPEGCYYLAATITNNTTGESITITGGMLLDETLVMDCDTKDLYLKDDNTYPASNGYSSTRRDWLNLQPGSNELQFDDTGTGSVTIAVTWEDRHS